MTSTPKYYTQKLRILELIENAKPGDPLPTERALAQQFQTSRTTIRQALTELVMEGRIERSQGRGTFVADPPLIDVRQLTSFSEDLTGAALDSTILEIRRVPAPGSVSAALQLPLDSEVTVVERVRRREAEPLAHETAYLAGSYPNIADELARRGSLYDTLREVYDITLGAAEDEVGTELATPHEAALLGIEVGQPLLVVHRTALDTAGVPVERTRSVFRGDRFKFRASTGTR